MDNGIKRMVDDRFDDFVRELVELVRRPSVSATGEGVEECADYLVAKMERWGIDAEIEQVPDGEPVIIGRVGPEGKCPTLLVYDHYDVQPPEPLDEWEYEPFSGEISGERMYGRGTTDSKGNLMAYLSAVRLLSETGKMPLSVKFLFEGEEEIGSPHLRSFVSSTDSLDADAVVCCDSELDPSGRPMISLGMKGLIYLELRSRAAKTDMHSSKAALVPSAAWNLVDALRSLRDSEGNIQIEGWTDGLVEPTEEEIELLRKIPFDEEEIRKETGARELLRGRHGLEALRGFLYEPTCNIAGLTSGYQGEGSKTVLPAEASAKLDMRLVYDQSAERCIQLLRDHLAVKGFGELEITVHGRLEPSHTPLSAPISRAAADAAREVYETDAVIYPKHHASGPDYIFTKDLGMHSIWTGCSPADGRAHAPNEFIGLEEYRKGILYACELISRFAGESSQ